MEEKDRFGSCERCQRHARVTFAHDGEAKEYKWLCWNCKVVSSGRWTAASLLEVDRQQTEVLREDLQERIDAGTAHSSHPPPQGPVLVVEDDAALREVICNLLETEGFPTARASDGKEALAVIHNLRPPPRMILLDLLMPAMNGFEFYEEISRDRELSAIPVVVMTAQKSVQMGSLTLLHKPVRLETLLATVLTICST